MGSNLKIQKLHFVNVKVSESPLIPTFSILNFISSSSSSSRSSSRTRTCIKTSLPLNKLHSLSLSSSSSPPAPVSLSENSSNEHSFEVSYLINTLGWSPEFAISRGRDLKFNTSEKPDMVLAFFKKHGFTKTQISKLVKHYARLILCDPQKTLLPKLEFLSSIGLSTTEIPSIVTAAPQFLKRSLKKIVLPSYNILRSLVGSDDKTVEMIKRYPLILTRDPEVDNIQILQEVGVPEANIVASMGFRHRGYKFTGDAYRRLVEKVKEMGFDPSQMKFLQALRAMRSMSKSTWERKVQALKKYGLSDHDILLAFENDPKFIMSSEDKIVRAMDFLANRMGMEAVTIAHLPKLIEMSLEKRIVPRWLIYQVLLEKGLFNGKRKPTIRTLFDLTENMFVRKVIEPYENEVPELFNFYQEMLSKSK